MCPHLDTEAVTLSDGELVAQVCLACHAQLPPSWGCDDCQYAEIQTLSSLSVGRVMTQLCAEHSV